MHTSLSLRYDFPSEPHSVYQVVNLILDEVIDSGLVGSTDFGRGNARPEKLKGHLPRVINQVY